MEKEIKIFKSMKKCIISTYGHCGIDWITSLLDNHKDILIMPSFSFFRCFYYIKTWNKEFDIERRKLSNKLIVNEFIRLFKKDSRQNTQRRKFLFNNKQYIIFKKSFLLWLNKSKIENIYENIFLGIHYAFSKVYKIDIKKKKILIAQEHVPFHSQKYEKILNPKFLFIVRDPRAAIAGSILRMEKHNSGKIYSNQFDQIILTWKWSQKFIDNNKNLDIHVAKNESMHKNLRREMKIISNWLGINFEKSLLKQTVLGKIWYGESSYLQGKNQDSDLKKSPPKNYYKPEEIKKRWKSILNDSDIRMIEVILRKIIIKYNYRFLKKNNIFSIIKTYFYLLINFNYQKKYFVSKFIIIPRNILRRTIILLNPNLVNFIYRFH